MPATFFVALGTSCEGAPNREYHHHQGPAAAAAKAEGQQQCPWLRHRKPVTADTELAPGAADSPRPFAAQVKAARLATNLRPQLLTRQEVVALVGLTYPSIWLMMREGRFPRSRVVGGKSMWVASEIDAWVDALPVRPLKPLDEARRIGISVGNNAAWQAARGRP